MESLEAMRLLISVIEAGSFSAAARITGQSPASVSRKMARLEDSVGAKLLDRNSRNLGLTTIGEHYFDKVSQIISQIDHLNTAISEQQTIPRGTLKFHTSPAICERFLGEVIPAFLKQYPEIELDVELSDHVPDPGDTTIHVDLRVGMPNDPDLVIRRLSHGVESVLCGSRSYFAKHSSISSVEDLATHNFISVQQNGHGDPVVFCRTTAGKKEIPVSGNLKVSDIRLLFEAIRSGVGLGLIPAWLVASDLAEGRIVRVLPDVEMTHSAFDHGIFAVFRRNDLILPKVRVFVDFLVEAFRRLDAEISQIAMSIRQQSVEHEVRAPDAMRWINPGGINRR